MAGGERNSQTGTRAALALVAALIVAAAVVALGGTLGGGSEDQPAPTASAPDAVRTAPKVKAPNLPQIALVRQKTPLRAKPGGRQLAQIGTKTTWSNAAWRSPRVLPVLERRGDWLRVIAPELPNNRTGWIVAGDTKLGTTPYKVRIDLSKRTISVLEDGKTVRKMRAAVGEQGTPTPTGTFAVTDRFDFTDAASPYGCCALALSAHQKEFASGWTGGDRVAIHATPTKTSIGRAATHGCMRIPDADAEWLTANVPLGTVVTIRA